MQCWHDIATNRSLVCVLHCACLQGISVRQGVTQVTGMCMGTCMLARLGVGLMVLLGLPRSGVLASSVVVICTHLKWHYMPESRFDSLQSMTTLKRHPVSITASIDRASDVSGVREQSNVTHQSNVRSDSTLLIHT